MNCDRNRTTGSPESLGQWTDGVWADPRLSVGAKATASVMARHARRLPDGTYRVTETEELVREVEVAVDLLAAVAKAAER